MLNINVIRDRSFFVVASFPYNFSLPGEL